jgi:hypothetical protein
VGPRFSGKVREEPQRRERKWGGYETKTSAIRKPWTSEPVVEAVKKTTTKKRNQVLQSHIPYRSPHSARSLIARPVPHLACIS